MTPRRILVVDDDPLQVETLGDILALHGWEVHGAFSGLDAVEAAEGGRYPIILMDIKMPGMSGVAAFKAIRARQPAVKVLLMTAYSEPALLVEAQGVGGVTVLPKPVEVASLLSALDAELVRPNQDSPRRY